MCHFGGPHRDWNLIVGGVHCDDLEVIFGLFAPKGRGGKSPCDRAYILIRPRRYGETQMGRL